MVREICISTNVFELEVNYKDIIFDFKRREVVKSNEEKNLHIQSLEILPLLLPKIPAGYSVREQIYDIVWNEPYSEDKYCDEPYQAIFEGKIVDDRVISLYSDFGGVGY